MDRPQVDGAGSNSDFWELDTGNMHNPRLSQDPTEKSVV